MQKKNLLHKLYEKLRALAKNDKYQLLYNQHEKTGIRIFNNISDLTDFQKTFLQFLTMYSGINMDIYMGEVSDIVLDNTIYEDSYICYRGQEKKDNKKKNSKLSKKSKDSVRDRRNIASTHVVFSKPKIK